MIENIKNFCEKHDKNPKKNIKNETIINVFFLPKTSLMYPPINEPNVIPQNNKVANITISSLSKFHCSLIIGKSKDNVTNSAPSARVAKPRIYITDNWIFNY